jgi:hypothetical protein
MIHDGISKMGTASLCPMLLRLQGSSPRKTRSVLIGLDRCHRRAWWLKRLLAIDKGDEIVTNV